jgi:uncharacterized protein YebE (UPF0316 family)
MNLVLTPQVWLGAGLIFILRVANMALDTVRALMVMRGRKWITWILGVLQTVIYVYVLTTVIQDLTNVVNLVAYAVGFATGNVVGMWIEERMALGHMQIQIISSNLGTAIAMRLREEGFAVTEFSGRGKDGTVTMLSASVLRKNAKKAHQIVSEVDAEAFITAEDMRPVRRGFWGLQK